MSDSATPWTVAHQAPLSMGFSRQEYWSGALKARRSLTAFLRPPKVPRHTGFPRGEHRGSRRGSLRTMHGLTKSSACGRLWQFAHPWPLSLLQRGLAPRSKGKAPGSQASSRGKPRTPPSSRVATRVFGNPLSGLKGVQPLLQFGDMTGIGKTPVPRKSSQQMAISLCGAKSRAVFPGCL